MQVGIKLVLMDLLIKSVLHIPQFLTSYRPDGIAESTIFVIQIKYMFCKVSHLLISLSGPRKPKDLDPRLMVPFFDIVFPYLPEKILKPLRFGVRYDEVSTILERNALCTLC